MLTLKSVLSRLEYVLFPLMLTIFEGVFIFLFGFLVEYDERGAPDGELETAVLFANDTTRDYVKELPSTQSTVKTYAFFQDVHVMVFIGFGFLMTFLRRYGYSSVGFNLLVAAFAIQWSTITEGVFTFIDECCTIRVNLETMVGSDFAAAAALITMGAVLGRASPFQLIIITFFEMMFFSANQALNIHVFKAADVGGSMIIHTFGAYFGLAVSFALYRKNATDHPRNSSVYHSDMFAMIGTLFLWLFWPSFNGALASGNAQYRAIINTYYSLTGSVICAVIMSMYLHKNKKISMTDIQNATLCGGVAIGSVADMIIQPWAAILIGMLCCVVSVFGYSCISALMEKYLRLQDTCGVHNLHGLPGVFSGVASIVAAGVAGLTDGSGRTFYGHSLFLTFPERAPVSASDFPNPELAAALGLEEGSGRSAGDQALFQLALLATTLAISIVGGLCTGVVVRFLPAFEGISKDTEYFDDRLYWELPDDADKYLPENNPTDGQASPTCAGSVRQRCCGGGTSSSGGGGGGNKEPAAPPFKESETSVDFKVEETTI